ncbi:MAG TPA: arsenate reductase ArsC [Pyrinomonadaceae bacterium]|nr:arsenate reductase ArsC [Pyrinomonadaceae bacterium]
MNTQSQPLKVLFLCTGNSARSIFGEYLLRRAGGERFAVHSAGASPTGKVNPFAIRVLKDVYDLDASSARSKSWEEFEGTQFDFVITVCDNARDSCPVWPGHPAMIHWSLPDPARAQGTDAEVYDTFKNVASEIERRVEQFMSDNSDR